MHQHKATYRQKQTAQNKPLTVSGEAAITVSDILSISWQVMGILVAFTLLTICQFEHLLVFCVCLALKNTLEKIKHNNKQLT